jgi:hypothetical protein
MVPGPDSLSLNFIKPKHQMISKLKDKPSPST